MKMVMTREEKRELKTVWYLVQEEERNISDDEYHNYIDSITFFRRLGGTETTTYAYTSAGYKVIKLVSTSPDKRYRTVRRFIFDEKK